MSHQCNQPDCPGYRTPGPARDAGTIYEEDPTISYADALRAELGAVGKTPAEALKSAVEAATAALDAAHAAGLIIPPQAAAGVAVLDTTALLLSNQIRDRSIT